jgi:hypothetical protein
MSLTFKSNLNNVNQNIRSICLVNMANACSFLSDEIKNTVSKTSGNGRIYIIGGRVHRASAPGEPPAKLYGDLYDSISYITEISGSRIHGEVFATDEKASWLEFGTSRMAKRPFFQSTYDRVYNRFISKLKGE